MSSKVVLVLAAVVFTGCAASADEATKASDSELRLVSAERVLAEVERMGTFRDSDSRNSVTFTDDAYAYQCDPHAGVMSGSCTVGMVATTTAAAKKALRKTR